MLVLICESSSQIYKMRRVLRFFGRRKWHFRLETCPIRWCACLIGQSGWNLYVPYQITSYLWSHDRRELDASGIRSRHIVSDTIHLHSSQVGIVLLWELSALSGTVIWTKLNKLYLENLDWNYICEFTVSSLSILSSGCLNTFAFPELLVRRRFTL